MCINTMTRNKSIQEILGTIVIYARDPFYCVTDNIAAISYGIVGTKYHIIMPFLQA